MPFHISSRSTKANLDLVPTEQTLVKSSLPAVTDKTKVEQRLGHSSRKYQPQIDITQHNRPTSRQGSGTTRNFKHNSVTIGTLPKRSNSTVASPSRVASEQLQPASILQSQSNESRSGIQPMGSVLDKDRGRSRRERTFVGGECAVCEELLEHTLSGEKILQFSCGHVAHEACFYEYMRDMDLQSCPTCDAPLRLDSSRGGSILDLSKLSSMVRAIQHDSHPSRSVQNTPLPWDRQNSRDDYINARDQGNWASTQDPQHENHDDQQTPTGRITSVHNHSRTNSEDHPTEYSTQEAIPAGDGRQHDYDLHAMETTVTGPVPQRLDFDIPAPHVTIRSEFPTLTRSRHQQSLTCLVTVEVPPAKWQNRSTNPSTQHSISTKSPHKQQQHALPRQAMSKRPFIPQESPEALERIAAGLLQRVENWHGLECDRFGPLRLHANIRVGKDRQTWQQLECYLFGEMLICVKEKKSSGRTIGDEGRPVTRATLKGSILIRRHLRHVQASLEDRVLTLTLTVAELPTFHLQFRDEDEFMMWRFALTEMHGSEGILPHSADYEQDTSGTEEDEWGRRMASGKKTSSIASSFGRNTNTTAATEYSTNQIYTDSNLPPSIHIPLDIVVVIPVSSSMQGLKISLLRDTLRFLVSNLGERDRMGLVTFGSSPGGVPLVGMTTKAWTGWEKVLNNIKPVGQKNLRADAVEGANVAMDLLMQRQGTNPISSILLISDSATSELDSVDFVVQRAEAAKVGIYTFGLGLTHKPDIMIELSSRTKASYVYIKDWMMLRDCVAGCLGSLQSISHQAAKIKLKLPEGSPAKFAKVSGALQTTKRATGRDAEAMLGDLRFGDKRDILVQLVINPDTTSQEQVPQDHWESIVSGLEALGGSLENDEQRPQSVEEVPLLQAGLIFSDFQKNGSHSQIPQPSLLTITMLPAPPKSKHGNRPSISLIPPHPSIVHRRMELLASDMLTRALTLVSRNQHERAQHLLNETRTILKGLGKGGLPPLPPVANNQVTNTIKHNSPSLGPKLSSSPAQESPLHQIQTQTQTHQSRSRRENSPDSRSSTTSTSNPNPPPYPPKTAIDHKIMNSLDADIVSSLEWIDHPAIFSRDSRKHALQTIGVIASQRGFTLRTTTEAMFAERIAGVRRCIQLSREWRNQEGFEDGLTEES